MIINDNPKLQVDVPNYSGFTMDHYGSLWIHYIQFGTSTMDHYGFSSCLVTIGCAAWQIMRYQGRMMKGPALGVLGHTLRLVTSMTRIVPRKGKRCRKTTQNISSVSTCFHDFFLTYEKNDVSPINFKVFTQGPSVDPPSDASNRRCRPRRSGGPRPGSIAQ